MWRLGSGSHAGRAVVLLAEGEHDLETSPGTGAPPSAWLERYVVGWTARCACGWHASPWFRAEEPWDTDEAERFFYSQDHSPVPARVLELLEVDWRAHVQPEVALDVLEQRVTEQREAMRLVDEAVWDARDHGASWAEIARRVGTSRQAAHQRWGAAGARQRP